LESRFGSMWWTGTGTDARWDGCTWTTTMDRRSASTASWSGQGWHGYTGSTAEARNFSGLNKKRGVRERGSGRIPTRFLPGCSDKAGSG